MTKNNIVKWVIMMGLWSILYIPFFVADSMFFPYISGKNFAFRIIVEIIFALWVYLAFVDAKYRPKFSWVSVSVAAFVVAMAIADIFAVNPLKAIWSNYERMDGFVTLLHLLMYLFVFGNILKSEKSWLWFFRSSLAASMCMMFPVFAEIAKVTGSRISVTLGNPIYVAVYFMFNFFFALILLYKDVILNAVNTHNPFRSIFSNWLTYVYAVAIYFCSFSIWQTQTRGVILGLLGGLMVTSIIIALFEKKNKFLKNSSIALLIAIAVLVGGFLTVKNTQFVQKNATLKRLADISWSNVQGQGQARQYVWPMALKGFAEKPVFGWGQDGFNNVFNKYYDVRMYNQEQWFDRAHDTPLDVLVAGGALGLITYLVMFIAAIYVVTRKKNTLDVTETGLLIGLLAAYFAQNIFVFDNLISYVLFFVTLSYIYARDTKGESKDARIISEDTANYILLPILIVIFSGMIWYVNIKPITANKDLIMAMQSLQTQPPRPDISLEYFKKVFDANTFGSPEAREQIVSLTPSIANASGVSAEIKQGFADLAYIEMQKQLEQNPADARYQFFMGVFLDNMNQYALALPHLQKALELSPNKLTMMFELAKCYSYLGEKQKALEVNKKAYELMPEYSDARMNYVSSLILNDQESLAKDVMGTSSANESIVRIYLIKASAFVQKGDKQSAVNEIQKAIKMVPGFKGQGDTIIKGVLDGTLK